MSDSTTIAKNTIVLFLGEITAHIFGFVITIILARYLGDEGFGIFSFAFAFAQTALIFSDIGVSTLMVREVSRNPRRIKKFASNIFVVKILLSLLMIIPLFSILPFLGKPLTVIYSLYIAILAMIFLEFSFFFRKFFNVNQMLEYEAFVKVFEKFMTLLIVLLFVWRGFEVVAIVTALMISYFLTCLLSYIYATRKISKLDFNLLSARFLGYLFKHSWQFWLASVFAVIYFKIDTIMLSFMSTFSAVGWYNAAYKLIDGLNFIPTLFIVAIFPAMSVLYLRNKQYLGLVFEKTVYYLLLIAIPIGVGISLLAERFILLFYTSEYANAILALQILVWAEVFVFINYFTGFLLNSIDKQRLFTLTTFIGLILNIILNLILIPKYGIYGAAFATLATEVLNFIMLYHFSRKNGYTFNIIRIVYKPIFAAVIMGIVIYYSLSLNLILILILAIVTYFAAMLVIKGLGKQEFDLFLRAIKKLKEKN